MALVVRIDTREYIGYFVGLPGPLEAGAHGHMFDAWRCPDGRLRHEPPAPSSAAAGPADRPSPVKLCIPVSDPAAAHLELMVSPTYLEFITDHPAFRGFPPRRWRRNGLGALIRKIRRNRR